MTERAAPTTRLAAYLRRLGLDEAPPPTLASLVDLHRRHLARVPYENLGIMLDRPPSVDPVECLDRVGRVGRAGYCFHQNGALEIALRELGFAVERRHGHVWTDESQRAAGSLNHLVLVVSGLATPDNPGGRWWVDVGLGDAFRDPLPLVEGAHRQGSFTYRLDRVRVDGWAFRHDPTGTFTGVEVSSAPTDQSAVLAAHRELSTPPEGHFTRLLVVQRRHATGVDTVRGCLLLRLDADGCTETELASYDAWRGALTDVLGLSLEDLSDGALRALWGRTRRAHEAWDAAGRP